MMKFNFARGVVLCLMMAFGTLGVLAAAPPAADLSVEMRGSGNPYVWTPYVYRARVENIGGTRAENAKVTIDLPLTNTSNVVPMGRISSIDSRCQLVNNKLECDLGRIKAGRRKTVKFTYVRPVSTNPISFTATSTADIDANANNDTDTKVLNPRYPDNMITAPQDFTNFYCTGSNVLSSFYECGIPPIRTSDHDMTLNADGTISFPTLSYTGTWYQPSPKELKFSYWYGSTPILEFHGYAISSTCFDGISTYPLRPQNVSPYRVCFQ